jgi:hypothetical protein
MAGDKLEMKQIRWIGGHTQNFVGGAADGGDVRVDHRCRRFRLPEEDGPALRLGLDQRFQSRIVGLGGHERLRETSHRRTRITASYLLYEIFADAARRSEPNGHCRCAITISFR